MIDWQWIPGTVVAAGALGHSLWLSGRSWFKLEGRATELRNQVDAQYQHGLQLWPRPWIGGRPLTQVEEVIETGKGWLGDPLDPEEQRKRMTRDSQHLLDSYKPPGGREE